MLAFRALPIVQDVPAETFGLQLRARAPLRLHSAICAGASCSFMATPSAPHGRRARAITLICWRLPILTSRGRCCGAVQTTAAKRDLPVAFDAGGTRPYQTLSSPVSAAFSGAPSNLEWRPFVSPELPAPGSPVVWLPDRVVAKLTVTADLGDVIEDRDFSLSQLSVSAHIHFDATGHQIIVLQCETYQITLIVEGALVTLGDIRLQFSATAIHSLERHSAALKALLHVLNQHKLSGPSLRPGPADAMHYRNAIIAIDGERAGATRREIASAIYGRDDVDNEWSHSDRLKAMVKRDVQRGRRLLAGGWRDLVAGGTVTPRA